MSAAAQFLFVSDSYRENMYCAFAPAVISGDAAEGGAMLCLPNTMYSIFARMPTEIGAKPARVHVWIIIASLNPNVVRFNNHPVDVQHVCSVLHTRMYLNACTYTHKYIYIYICSHHLPDVGSRLHTYTIGSDPSPDYSSPNVLPPPGVHIDSVLS